MLGGDAVRISARRRGSAEPLPFVEQADVPSGPDDECIGDDAVDPVEGFGEGERGGWKDGDGAREVVEYEGGGRTDIAAGIDGEWREPEAGVALELDGILLPLPSLSSRSGGAGWAAEGGDDGYINRQACRMLRMIVDPYVSRPSAVRIEDLASVAGSAQACGNGNIP